MIMKQQQTIADPQAAPAMSSSIVEKVIADMMQLQQSLLMLEKEGLSLLPSTRRLKIQPLIRERDHDPFHTVPGLNLNGKWLMDSGFNYHEHARIIPMAGMLVICPEKVP
jgi:hypothetical protein